MATTEPSLHWSSQYDVAFTSKSLPGDKILLPPSALEQLLSAASTVVVEPQQSYPSTSTFDPFNRYSFAAERYARSQLRDVQQQLPHPLTFRLVNPNNGRVVHAGIREFSAEEGHIVLSSFLRQALGFDQGTSNSEATPLDGKDGNGSLKENSTKPARLTVHAKTLAKGKYVRLRPLEAGYDPEDWKSLLEQHLRKNFTTLTNGEMLSVPSGRRAGGKIEEFRFLVDKLEPDGEGICVVDTDLEVDIEPLNEEQARETLQRRLASAQQRGVGSGSSAGGELDLGKAQEGQVQEGEYVDYQISSWDRARGVEIELAGVDDEDEVDLLVSPFSSRQRARPREDEHVLGDFSNRYPKRIRLESTNVTLEDAEAIWVSVHAYPTSQPVQSSTPKSFSLRATPIDPSQPSATTSNPHHPAADEPLSPDETCCPNCRQPVPKRTMLLHESFCARNNVLCPQCRTVFKKSSPEWAHHWHCALDPSDSAHGNTATSQAKHVALAHTPRPCPKCTHMAPSVVALAHHRTTTCPGKPIICQFCHLLVAQGGADDDNDDDAAANDAEPLDPAVLLSYANLTPHEYADGARTTDCHLCKRIVRLRDMASHLRHHDLERRSRPRPLLCRNANCGRILGGSGGGGGGGSTAGKNSLGLCSFCFGPLYVSMYDPDGRALRRRVERRYLTQLVSGCGKAWCVNVFCRSGRSRAEASGAGSAPAPAMQTKDALALVKPFVEGLTRTGADSRFESPLHFCVDEQSQRRRELAGVLEAEGGGDGYGLEWWVAALEAGGGGGDVGRAREWLRDWAVRRGEGG